MPIPTRLVNTKPTARWAIVPPKTAMAATTPRRSPGVTRDLQKKMACGLEKTGKERHEDLVERLHGC